MPSTAIRFISYGVQSHELLVTFVTTGKTYGYAGVPEEVYREFLRAESRGQYFNLNIRDRYPYREIKRRA